MNCLLVTNSMITFYCSWLLKQQLKWQCFSIMSYNTMQGSLAPVTHQDVLECAGRLIDKHLQEDRSGHDLSKLLRVPVHSKSVIQFTVDISPKLMFTHFCWFKTVKYCSCFYALRGNIAVILNLRIRQSKVSPNKYTKERAVSLL